MGLKFREYGGKVEFNYREPNEHGGTYLIDGEIPKEIIEQGKEAILKYAQTEINKSKEIIRRNKSIEDEIRKNHIDIKTKYGDVTLEGRIVEATSREISVKLDKPVEGKKTINYGWAAAMAGKRVFTKKHNISENGYDTARRAMKEIYEDFLNKPRRDLVDSLNEELD